MYTIIVVDDEFIIREGIVNTIPWNNWGFEVIGQAKNGIEAIKLIDKRVPDVILTDIKMPHMSGIELIKILAEKYSQIEIVLLSGYSDIEYYKKAIEYRVAEYLLKPTCYDDFEKTFKKMKNKFDEKKKKVLEYKELKKQLVESLPYMKQIFLKKLVRGYYKEITIIEEKTNFYNINLKMKGEKFIVIALCIDNYIMLKNKYSEEHNHLLKISVMYLANQLVKKYGCGEFYLEDNDIIVGIYSLQDNYYSIIDMIENLQNAVHDLKGITISAGLSSECLDIKKLNIYYNQAILTLKQKIFLGDESITSYNDIDVKSIKYIEYKFQNDKIIDYIFYRGKGNPEEMIDEVFTFFRNKLIKNYDYIDKLWNELYISIARDALRYNINLDELLENSKLNVEDISNLDSLELKKQWIIEIIEKTKMLINDERVDNNCKLISQIKEYINEHYCENSMSLGIVANTFNKNPAYISKLFKNETGDKFLDYIIKLRINKAKELLNDVSIKTYEIAEMVGYADTSHFIKVFKKYTGMSTSEYRETH
ncbi:MAG: response regulator [Vallitalea sp.]|jgi:two-component system response regulator YesN|nr:response regulator [Vallitalea sp.]